MKTIVFISTLHRSSQRFISVLEDLSKDFDILILNVGQASNKTNYADSKSYQEKIKKFKTINSIAIKNQSERNDRNYVNNILNIYSSLDFENTACVILDDTRNKNQESFLYKKCENLRIPVIGNSHGHQELETNKILLKENYKKVFNHFFVLGKNEKNDLIQSGYDEKFIIPAGIPNNDELFKFKQKKSDEYILVITNFLLPNQPNNGVFYYDKKVLHGLKLLELQKKIDRKVVFKIKHRLNADLDLEIKTLKSNIPEGLNYEILINCDNENEMLIKSSCILSYGSTLSFKGIQLGIPTAIFKNLGVLGNFKKYPYTFSLGEDYFNIFENNKKSIDEFLDYCVEGAKTFTSTNVYSSQVRKIIKGNFYEQLR